MEKLKELREKLAAKQKELDGIFQEAGAEYDLEKVKSIEGTTAEKVAEIKRRHEEMNDFGDQIEGLVTVERAQQSLQRMKDEPAGAITHPSGGATRPKTLGEYVVGSEGYKSTAGKSKRAFGIEYVDIWDPVVYLKTLFQTTAGFPPETTRTGRIVEAALLGPQVLDLIPSVPTEQAAVVFMRETVTTQAAAERAEAGLYAEAGISYAEDSSTVRSLGVSLPITDEQLEDVPGVQGLIDGRLLLFLRRRLDLQVLLGDGIAPNLRGILNVAGIQTQAKGTDPVFDAIHKAITLVAITGAANPSAIVLHPNDWQDIRLTRTADGIYILGNPADPGLMRLWGLPVVISDRITENTGLVGDFATHSELRPRRGAEVQVGFVSDDFTRGKQTIRAGLRTAFVVYRAAAFASVSGI